MRAYQPTNQSHHQDDTRLERWLGAVQSMEAPTVITCDFDGTLTPRYADDEMHFSNIEGIAKPVLQSILSSSELIGGVCTSRSLLEVNRILDLGFRDSQGRSLAGFSAAENGAVVFSSKLSSKSEQILRNAGYRIEESLNGMTIINLAKVSPGYLMQNVVKPALREVNIPDEQWSSSLGNNEERAHFQRLYQMSRHSSPERTHDACVRYGSGYVKVEDTEIGRSFIGKLQACADALSVLCLITPPLDGHPVWTADLGGGVTKYDAMHSISQVYATLAGVTEDQLRFAYFGDGENDLPAFEYISKRPGHNQAYLIDIPHGTNDERAQRVASGTVYLHGFYDIHGVKEGVRQFSGQ